MASEKTQEALEEINARLAKRFKGRAPVLFTADELPELEWISTGILALDWLNGGGGPRGRVEQLVGTKSSGKSSLSLRRIAEAQRQGLVCAYIDVEHTLDRGWARKMGVKLEELIVYAPEDYDSAEVTLDVVIDLLKASDVDLIVLDSVTSLCPEAKIKGTMEDKHYAGVAGVLTQFFDKIIGPGILANSNCNLLLINQPRDVIGARFHTERIPGGKSLAHNSSIITMVREGDFIFAGTSKDSEKIGKEVRLQNIKNKCRWPYRESTVSLYFETGFNPLLDVIQFSEKYEIMEHSGTWAYYNGEQVGQGRQNQAAWLLKHPDVYREIKAKARSLILEGK